MRNLELESLQIDTIPVGLKNAKCLIHVEENVFILVDNCVYHIQDSEKSVISNNNIQTLEWLPLENVIFMGNGTSFECYNIHSKESTDVFIEEGYVVHAWNPMQDKLALISSAGLVRILLLNVHSASFTVCGQYNLKDTDKSAFVNVGWGSAQTQFRGSEGKLLKSDFPKECVVKHDDGVPRIVWRDDGEFFVIGFIENDNRVFKVFSQECEFLYNSELLIGLCAPLNWKPDGSVITAEQKLLDSHNIIFFEKNGLYRYEFPLRNNIPIEKILWNPLGDILMIWHKDNVDINLSEVSLWISKNYKWYLKQNLLFNHDNPIVDVNWNDKRSLEIITTKNILRYNWRWTVHMSSDPDLGVIAVIDGKNVQFTVTTKQVIPPPLCTYKYEFERPVNFITFSLNTNDMGVILDNGAFRIMKYCENTIIMDEHTLFDINLINCDIPLSVNHYAYDFNKNTLLAVQSMNEASMIYKFEKTVKGFKCRELCSIPDKITSLFIADSDINFIVHSGEVVMHQSYDKVILCENVPVGNLAVKYLHKNYHTFCLSNDNNFYFDNKKITNNFTSYLFCNDYLLTTTIDNRLLCIKLSEKGLSKLKDGNFADVYSRSIPIGGLIIGAVPNTRKVILQVPRGELETISPRVLSIEELEKQMSTGNYLAAYKIMRTDRLNPNILYDINPQRFNANIEEFIKAINNCEYLDVFLSQLQDHNVTEAMYGACFEDPLPKKPDNKLIGVTNQFIEVMKKLEANYYLQSIVTACICKNTSEDLEYALLSICKAKIREESGQKMRVPVDNILEHMIILSSVEKLYETALGMYHFDLLMWIASKSQLDPLEYLPFLRELNNMEENYRNYKINAHIKRYERAFQYLINCDHVRDELEYFICENNLYKYILKCVPPGNQWYESLLKLYADHLDKQGYYDESGIILQKIGLFQPAFDKFMKTGNVNEALCSIDQIDHNSRPNMHEKLVNKLVADKMYKEASWIYEEYLENYEKAIDVLVKGRFWSNAIRLCIKHKRKDLIVEIVKPEMYDYIKNISDTLNEIKENFVKNKTRIEIVRNQRISERKNYKNVHCAGDMDEVNSDRRFCDIDLESVASTQYSTVSNASRSSHMTSATSRRKKRIEKKVMQLREGSAFEDIALMRNLHTLITEAQTYSSNVHDICKILLSFDDYEYAVDLYTKFKDLVDIMNKSFDIIWPTELLNPTDTTTIEYQVFHENIEHLDHQYRYPPQQLKLKKLYSLE